MVCRRGLHDISTWESRVFYSKWHPLGECRSCHFEKLRSRAKVRPGYCRKNLHRLVSAGGALTRRAREVRAVESRTGSVKYYVQCQECKRKRQVEYDRKRAAEGWTRVVCVRKCKYKVERPPGDSNGYMCARCRRDPQARVMAVKLGKTVLDFTPPHLRAKESRVRASRVA